MLGAVLGSEAPGGKPAAHYRAVTTDVAVHVPATAVQAGFAIGVCTHHIDPSVSTADGGRNYSAVKGGDVVCVAAGTRGPLSLTNFRGEPNNPIIFVNAGGVAEIVSNGFAGIGITNSRRIRITGAGVSDHCGAAIGDVSVQQCGFKISAPRGRGIDGRNRVSDITIDHVEVHTTAYSGITIKTKHDRDGVTREQFTQYNTHLHNNYIHDTAKEGFYIGASGYKAAGLDPVLRGVDIHDNLVADTGWDGIQVGSAVEDCFIHHNRVYRDSKANRAKQRSGIMINPGSVCHVYNNFLKDGLAAHGIYVQGSGGNRIYNNVILNRTQNDGRGITVATGSNSDRNIYIFNNTIVHIEGKGIDFSNTSGRDNRIQNNILVHVRGKDIDVGIALASHNMSEARPDTIGFANPGEDDYSLLAGSPAIDAGTNVAAYGITDDYAGTPRPQGPAYDIGAYEFRDQPSPTGTTSRGSTDRTAWLHSQRNK